MAHLFRIPQSKLAHYAMALFASVVAAVLHWAIEPLTDSRIPFLFFLPTILLIATSLGRGPALFVLVSGLVNGVLIMSGEYHIPALTLPNLIAILAYLSVSLIMAEYGSRLQLVTRQKADTEQRLSLVQTSTSVGLYEIDLNQETVLGSAPFWELLGAPPKITSVPLALWTERLHPDDKAQAIQVLQQKAGEGRLSFDHEQRVVLGNGQVRWVSSRIAIDRDQQGRVARLRGAMGDITERKRTQALLETTQKELMQQVDDLHRLHELSARLVQVDDLNEQFNLILHSLAEFHGAHEGLISLFDAQESRLQIRASLGFGAESLEKLQELQTQESEAVGAHADKSRIIIDDTATDPRFVNWQSLATGAGFKAIHSTPLVSRTGNILGAIAIHLPNARRPTEREIRLADICARKVVVIVERRNALEAARESDRRLKVALQSAAVPFSILIPVRDASGKVIDFYWNYLNPAAVAILGRPLSELLGKRVQDILPFVWNQPELLANYVAVADCNEVREFELNYPRRDGIEGWFHVVASPLEGAVAAWYADVSERKHQEQALREADRRKDEFLATLAHELRNPLAPIRQAAVISKMAKATEAQKRWSHEVIERQVQHMALLLDDLLDVSRITRGRLELRTQRTELKQVIDAAVETARPFIDTKRQSLTIEVPEDPVIFDADPLRVAQVVSNLLTNAAKYTNAGGTIRLIAERKAGEAIIRIIDNGIGLDSHELPEIFKMFAQVRNVHSNLQERAQERMHERSDGGLGIGLALAKGLVELHGGRIEAHSAGRNRGSEFVVHFPLKNDQSQAKSAAIEVPATQIPRRVLVADDNRDSAISLAMLLSMEGHDVKTAHDGAEAVAAFDAFQPDLVLLDIGMPKLNGYQVAKHIRSTAGDSVTLVAITGWGQESDKYRAIEAGFNHHFTKPLDPKLLHALFTSRN